VTHSPRRPNDVLMPERLKFKRSPGSTRVSVEFSRPWLAGPGALAVPRHDRDAAEVRASIAATTDATQAKLAYRWQTRVLGEALEYEPWPIACKSTEQLRASVSEWARSIWSEYSPAFAPAGPFFHAVPSIEIEPDGPSEAFCSSTTHWIRLRRNVCSRAIVLHELTHSLTWWDGHGADFAGASAWLWQRIFGIPRARSLAVAAELSLPINAEMPWRPSLRTRFAQELARERGIAV
jgi:hypothetical protein